MPDVVYFHETKCERDASNNSSMSTQRTDCERKYSQYTDSRWRHGLPVAGPTLFRVLMCGGFVDANVSGVCSSVSESSLAPTAGELTAHGKS